MDKAQGREPEKTIICVKCKIPLLPGKVTLAYVGSKFQVDLFKCPQCQLVFVPEDLAIGKMQQVEKSLEDK